MKLFASLALLVPSMAFSATPIDGAYTHLYGGYLYLPGNISNSIFNLNINQASYQNGYDAGFSMGYQLNPLRFDLDFNYLKAGLEGFNLNETAAIHPYGYNDAFFASSDIYFDLPVNNTLLNPFLGLGLGYAVIHHQIQSYLTNQNFNLNHSSNIFAYHAKAGIIYNFAENYALDLTYQYTRTKDDKYMGKYFQAHTANVGITYRFNGQFYK